MRGLVYQLRAPSVVEDGLYPVLHTFIDGVNGRNKVHVRLDSASETLPLTSVQQQDLYRIVQEAVNNVVKHAQADNVAVCFVLTEAAVTVTVTDDGAGFDPRRLGNDGTHIGLDSMRERAEELGGRLVISAKPGAGTEVKVVVPIAEDAP